MLEDRELDAAVAEAEVEYTADDQLVDAREFFPNQPLVTHELIEKIREKVV